MAIDFSIVLPCFNEAGNLLELHSRLTQTCARLAQYKFELLFVDDGSVDGSANIFEKLVQQDCRVKVLFFSRNFGSPQFAYLAGLRHAQGKAAILMDTDLQDPPEVIPELIEKWKQGFQVVLAQRLKRSESWLRKTCYFFFHRTFRLLSFLDIPLDAGEFCLLDRQVVDVIKKMPEVDVMIRGARAWAGFKKAIVMYKRDARKAGKTSFNFFGYLRMAKDAIVGFSDRLLEAISYLAIISAVLTSIVGLVYLYLAFTTSAPPGFFTLLMAILFFGTLQLLSLGIIAEYLIRIFREVKKRPPYVIARILQRENNDQASK